MPEVDHVLVAGLARRVQHERDNQREAVRVGRLGDDQVQRDAEDARDGALLLRDARAGLAQERADEAHHGGHVALVLEEVVGQHGLQQLPVRLGRLGAGLDRVEQLPDDLQCVGHHLDDVLLQDVHQRLPHQLLDVARDLGALAHDPRDGVEQEVRQLRVARVLRVCREVGVQRADHTASEVRHHRHRREAHNACDGAREVLVRLGAAVGEADAQVLQQLPNRRVVQRL